MNILLLSDDLLYGGVPRHVTDLANGLARRGEQVFLAATDGPMKRHLSKEVQWIPLSLTRRHSLKKNLFGMLAAIPILMRVIHGEQISHIHSHKRYCDLLARIVARVTGIRHLSTCHNTFDNHHRLSVFGDHTIACSSRIREMLIRRYQKRSETVHCIYNGIAPLQATSPGRCEERRCALNIDASTKIIVSVGHLSEAKDRKTLVEAADLLTHRKAAGNFVVLVIGEGDQKEALEERIHRLNLQPVFRFLPADTDISLFYTLADFCVLTSQQEGLPYVILEAASLGKPHIATDVGGVGNFITHHETGLLIQPRNPKQCAEAMEELLTSPGECQRLGRNARQKVISQHSVSQSLEQIHSLYIQLAKDKKTIHQ